MNYQEKLEIMLKRYEPLGVRNLANGTRLIGHVRHQAPDAYLHILFSGLNEKELSALEAKAGRPLPVCLKKFYAYSNGLELFSDSLSFYGLRTSYKRQGDEIWQPYCVSDPNVLERLSDASDDLFFFASYEWDGSLLYTSGCDKKINRCSAESSKPIGSWSSFEEMMGAEIERISKLFDKSGRPIDPERPTIP